MKGVIVNFRKGVHTQTDNQMVILPEGIEGPEKSKALIGKSVLWLTPSKKEIKGKITNLHGRKGAVRVLFERGMPGQSVGTKVEIS